MKAASRWNKVRLIGLICLALAPTLEAQQQPLREGARRELKLAPEGAEARPVVALVLSVFDALQRRDEAAVNIATVCTMFPRVTISWAAQRPKTD